MLKISDPNTKASLDPDSKVVDETGGASPADIGCGSPLFNSVATVDSILVFSVSVMCERPKINGYTYQASTGTKWDDFGPWCNVVLKIS